MHQVVEMNVDVLI